MSCASSSPIHMAVRNIRIGETASLAVDLLEVRCTTLEVELGVDVVDNATLEPRSFTVLEVVSVNRHVQNSRASSLKS